MDYVLKFIGVAGAMAIVDVCWAFYFIKVGERKSTQSGLWAIALFLSGAFVTTSYVHDHSLLIAAAIGSFIGTFLTVEYKKRKELKEKISE